MQEMLLAVCGGLLGSAHCVGMCGAFALAIGCGTHTWRQNISRQLCYTSGRMFTYGCGGLTASFLGQRLQEQTAQWLPMQAVLSLIAGAILIVQSLALLGVPLGTWGRRTSSSGCQAAGMFRTLLKVRSSSAVFLAGVATGFLPCALVYAYLALAAQTDSLWKGSAVMLAMGAGTAPLMLLTGVGAQSWNLMLRKRLLTGAAVVVCITGVITVYRGVAYLSTPHTSSPVCPFCRVAS